MKTLADFYVSSPKRCKECVKDQVRQRRQANLESVRAYDRARGSMSHRVAARTEYRKTRAYAQSHSAAARRWSAKHPERRRAQVELNNAVRDGRVTPWPVRALPECCSKPEGHHPDYSRPLDVVWLCAQHHDEVHQANTKVQPGSLAQP
ncbi:MAG: hypothetical protein ABI574_04700 [Burkholderiales bacterium]